MKVIDCPRCGGPVSKSTSSFEYGGSTTWDCDDCTWFYTSGRGIGVGSGNSGTHPRNAGPPDDQSTLIPVGEYCSDCEIVVAGEHSCSVVSAVGEDMIPLEDVIEEMSEYHGKYGARDVVEDSIKNREIVLTPTFYYVTLFDEEIFEEQMDLVQHEIECQAENSNSNIRFFHDDEVPVHKIHNKMDANKDIESTFIDECIKELNSRGRIRKYHGKVSPSDNEE